MVNYYETLKVSPKASRAEIKSAYRKLARKLHPDKNEGSEQTARAFAAIAEAYEILGNPKERADYDKKLLAARYNGNSEGDSVFTSGNVHARRWRQMIYDQRYNEIIDRMIAEERRQSMELQRMIFPIVALFVSTLIVGILRPQVFATPDGILFKIVLVSLAIAGAIHLVGRLRDGLDRYTFDAADLHDSIFEGNEPAPKSMSRWTAAVMILFGVVACFSLGLFIGYNVEIKSVVLDQLIFAESPRAEMLLYPPIFVLIVDLMHSFASRVESPASHLTLS